MRYSPATHAIAVIVGDGHATTTTPAPMEKIPANATSPRWVSDLSVIPDITSIAPVTIQRTPSTVASTATVSNGCRTTRTPVTIPTKPTKPTSPGASVSATKALMKAVRAVDSAETPG